MSNDKTSWKEILSAHWACTTERMRGHAVVLNIQDTTELDFNGQEISGLGPLSHEAQRGFYLYPAYAITPEREPLGVLDAWMWAREFKDENGQRSGIKESERWLEGYERVADYLVRYKHNRVLPEGGKLWSAVDKTAPLGHVRFLLPAGRGRKSRPVEQAIRTQQVTLPGEVSITCLVATEINPPAGAKPVTWTSLSVARVEF